MAAPATATGVFFAGKMKRRPLHFLAILLLLGLSLDSVVEALVRSAICDPFRSEKRSNLCQTFPRYLHQATSTAKSGAACEDALQVLLKKGELGSCVVRDLEDSPGFCNHLYEVQAESDQQRYVAKIFSGLALKRRPASRDPSYIDLLCSDLKIGPKVHAATERGILMDFLEGTPLTEGDIHGCSSGIGNSQVDDRLHEKVASQVSMLHKQEVLRKSENMLWHSLEAMLEYCRIESRHPEWNLLRDQVALHHEWLGNKLQLPTVLGHGDLKPSNLMLVKDDDDQVVKLIDFEIGGVHYRAFDLAKLFRTKCPNKNSEARQRAFLQAYSPKEPVDVLLAESALLLPMTWIEAATFFACTGEESLYQDRMECYHDAMSVWEDHLRDYQSIVVARSK